MSEPTWCTISANISPPKYHNRDGTTKTNVFARHVFLKRPPPSKPGIPRPTRRNRQVPPKIDVHDPQSALELLISTRSLDQLFEGHDATPVLVHSIENPQTSCQGYVGHACRMVSGRSRMDTKAHTQTPTENPIRNPSIPNESPWPESWPKSDRRIKNPATNLCGRGASAGASGRS